MTYEQLWPSQRHGRECLATEAETIDDAVFLAVHQPMRLYRAPIKEGSQREERTEEDLLNALLEEDPASGTLLIPIVGESGVGKSHMVHWLEAQLRHRPDGVERKVVRIPKSASLRRVLELILEKLEGPEYDAIRKKMVSAELTLSPMEATVGLREKLLLELDRRNKETRAQLQSNNVKALREIEAFTAPPCIPALLQDPGLNEHFIRGESSPKAVLWRIAERAMNGAAAIDGPPNQFNEQDLIFETVELKNLAKETRSAVLQLNSNGGEGRRIAVRILNDAVDLALSALLKFDGNSLSDLFVELRKQLLADGRELVLLVEDFAALAGIQNSLLDAMIRQAVEHGEQVLCVMRTVLAVTKGYLANRETVLTRARYEWHIEYRPFRTEDEAVETYANFVGGYLNAARCGKQRLERDFAKRSKDTETLQDWLPNYYEEHKGDLSPKDRAIVDAFGFSTRGNHPLFPFNKGAIRQLLKRKFFAEGKFEFDPRRLLGIVLRETLIESRPLFEQREFPPAGWLQFHSDELNISVMREIRDRHPLAADRLACLIFHWGDGPVTPGLAAAMPEEVHAAFHAPALSWSEKAVDRRDSEQSAESAKPKEQKKQTPQHPIIAKIDKWRSEKNLNQTDAAAIRKQLAGEIKAWIDWDILLLEEMELPIRGIHLPWVSIGNPSEGMRMATALDDTKAEDVVAGERFVAGLHAVFKHRANECSWNYEGGERDAAAYAALIEPMASETVQWLRGKKHDLTPGSIKSLAQGLLLGARLLRIPGAATNSGVDNLKAMLADAPPSESVPDEEKPWSKIRERARSVRPMMLEKLKQVVAARQGGGKVRAVDASALLPAIEELRKTKTLPAEVDLEGLPGPVAEHLRQLRGPLNAAVERRAKELGEWYAKVTGLLGENFEITDVIQQLRDAITEANKAHVYRQKEQLLPASLSAKIGELQQFTIKETLDLAKGATDAADLAVKINNIAQVDAKVEASVLGTLEQFESFLEQTEKEINGRLNGLPPSPADQGKRLAGVVEEIEKRWKELDNTK